MSEFVLEFLPSHDVQAYAETYHRDGIVRIDNLFPEATARAIQSALIRQTPWHPVHADAQGKHVYYTPQEWSELKPEIRNKTLQDVMISARDGFSYFYSCFPMVNAYLNGTFPDWPLHAMLEYLNGPESLAFFKAITGEDTATKLDGQATLYARGHFLNVHNDTGNNKERRAAYVMGFTDPWRHDWGGKLLFLEDERITDGFVPSFNTLTLFKVPRDHIVTQVTNFAGANRYSITGWLRDD